MNWKIITLQYFDGFCHTSTNGYRYTCVLWSWTLLPSPSLPHPSGLSQSITFGCPASCIKLALVIYLTYGNIRVSMLFSHIVPSLPSPTKPKSLFFISVSLLLSHILGHHYHLSKFHIYALIYCNGVFLSDLLYSGSRSLCYFHIHYTLLWKSHLSWEFN